MSDRIRTTSDDEARQPSLDEIIEAFEVVWNRDRQANIEDFIPDGDHPLFEEIALELLCVDLERRQQSGQEKSVEDYRRQFPHLLAQQRVLQRLAFEEYRLLKQRGGPG